MKSSPRHFLAAALALGLVGWASALGAGSATAVRCDTSVQGAAVHSNCHDWRVPNHPYLGHAPQGSWEAVFARGSW